MKVLLFTHEQDIDGLGCAVLAECSSLEYDLELCKTFELDEKIKKHIDDESIYNYDYIYVTDLCPNEEVLNIIESDNRLNKKFQILDHHKTAEKFNSYDFVSVISEEEKIKESGTSLFYKYLLNNGYLKSSNVLDELVEHTRAYDVWDWEKKKDFLARKLHIIFETQGIDFYLKTTRRMINKDKEVRLNANEESIVEDFNKRLRDVINSSLDKMVVENLEIDGAIFRVGYIITDYKYRNDVADIVREDNHEDIDAIGMIMNDRDTVSYRSIKNIDVSIIAYYFGGSGHKEAASNPKDNELFQSILKLVKN